MRNVTAAEDRSRARGARVERGATAVVGAGISGLALARRTAASAAAVVVIDKGRRPGGRASTRGEGAAAFDHGAQYLTARDPRFAREVESWRRAGVVAEWHGRIGVLAHGQATASSGGTRRFVGVPGMHAVARHLARGLDVRCGERVTRLSGAPGAWRLALASGAELGPFARVVVSAPPPQSAELLRGAAPALATRLAAARVRPCWAVLAEFERALPVELDGAFVPGSPLAWIAREASKPERAPGERWILHAAPDWSEARAALAPERAVALLLDALAGALGAPLPSVRIATGHLWRHATPEPALDEPYLFDDDLGIAVCGDALGGPRIEGAWLSGTALADALRVGT
ncbi:MAG: NAD(P)-binding protein [Planctomycetes bacterium]|nr:NAD(P)-binding protein [Planctomycetota bacterium]